MCPECGSDNETGWSDDAAYDDLFLYDDEPPADSLRPARWLRYLIAIVAALTLSAYLAYALAWGIYLIPVVLVAVGVAYYVTQGVETYHAGNLYVAFRDPGNIRLEYWQVIGD